MQRNFASSQQQSSGHFRLGLPKAGQPCGPQNYRAHWHRHVCHAQAQSQQLDSVKLSRKDVRELRDLMPTDENLLETSSEDEALMRQRSGSLNGTSPDWQYYDERRYRSLLENAPRRVHLADQEMAQLQYDIDARKRAVMDTAEANAIWIHHDQVARGGNVYAMTNWIASRMDDIEFEDAYIQQDELTMIPSWIRAFHDLEQNWEEFSAQRAEVEQFADKNQDLYEKRVAAEEMGMLDPLDTQEVESLEEKEEDPLDGLLEGILPNTGPLQDSDDFMLDIMPESADGEQEVQDFDDADADIYSRDFSMRAMEE